MLLVDMMVIVGNVWQVLKYIILILNQTLQQERWIAHLAFPNNNNNLKCNNKFNSKNPRFQKLKNHQQLVLPKRQKELSHLYEEASQLTKNKLELLVHHQVPPKDKATKTYKTLHLGKECVKNATSLKKTELSNRQDEDLHQKRSMKNNTRVMGKCLPTS